MKTDYKANVSATVEWQGKNHETLSENKYFFQDFIMQKRTKKILTHRNVVWIKRFHCIKKLELSFLVRGRMLKCKEAVPEKKKECFLLHKTVMNTTFPLTN